MRVYFSQMASPLRGTSTPTQADDARVTQSEAEAPPQPPPARSRPAFGVTDLSLLLMALIWGINYTSVKYGTNIIEPLAFNGVRVTLAAASLVVIAQLASRIFGVEPEGWPRRRDAIALLLLGTLGNGVYQILFVEGIARTRAGDAALLISASPAFIAIIGRLRGSEHVSFRGAIGIALSILGMGFVVIGTTNVSGAERATLLGDSLLLISALAWSVYTVYLQPYTHRIGGIHLSALTMVGGMVPLLAVALPTMVSSSWTHLPLLAWGSLAYSGLFALVIAYLFWYNGVRVLGPTRTAMYSNLQPIFAVAVAWLVLGEAITVWQVAGAVSIITGLLLTRS
jgi:drug/metabolite transporter (DMT)-like permease